MFVPLPTQVNQIQHLDGYFTKALYFRMQSQSELERRIGYQPGSLSKGYWLMFLTKLPTPDEFEFRGYSQMADGIAQGHLPQNRSKPNAEEMLRSSGVDLLRKKQQIISGVFRLSGPERLAKVRPVARPGDYPPGTGIPQWTLTKPIAWRAAAFIAPGQMYVGNYD